jgi:PAS domain S-box-containing protein
MNSMQANSFKKALTSTVSHKDLLETVMANTATMLAFFDPDFNFIMANKAYVDGCGYKWEELQGRNHFFLFPNRENEEIFRTVRDTGQSITFQDKPFEYSTQPGRGVTFWDWTLVPVKDDTGSVTGLVLSMIEITRRKQDEQILRSWKDELELRVEERTAELMEAQIQLERKRRLADIGMLASTVAHELRNPLAVIKAAVYNISRKKHDAVFDKHLYSIEKKIQESNQIINNLLMYSRIKQPFYEAVALIDLLHDCLETVQARYVGRSLTFHGECGPVEGLVAMLDRYQITEVINNLLTNAAQAVFSEAGGSVTLSAFSESGIVTINVTDTGAGIEAGDLALVFDPFFTRKSKGTGLGLTICKELVSLHNGSINIVSERGAGTTVSVVLPLTPVTQSSRR